MKVYVWMEEKQTRFAQSGAKLIIYLPHTVLQFSHVEKPKLWQPLLWELPAKQTKLICHLLKVRKLSTFTTTSLLSRLVKRAQFAVLPVEKLATETWRKEL